MPVNCATVGKQTEDPSGGCPFGSPDSERYRIRRKLHPIRQQLGGKEFSLNGTPNRPELEQGSESDTVPDPHRCPNRHFQKFLAGYILFAFQCLIIREPYSAFSSRSHLRVHLARHHPRCPWCRSLREAARRTFRQNAD